MQHVKIKFTGRTQCDYASIASRGAASVPVPMDRAFLEATAYAIWVNSPLTLPPTDGLDKSPVASQAHRPPHPTDTHNSYAHAPAAAAATVYTLSTILFGPTLPVRIAPIACIKR